MSGTFDVMDVNQFSPFGSRMVIGNLIPTILTPHQHQSQIENGPTPGRRCFSPHFSTTHLRFSASAPLLRGDAEILAPITALQQATRDLARSAALADDASQDYWRRAAAWLGVQRHRGWAALYGSYMRDPVNGAGAAGACMEPANAPPLPVFDPERVGVVG